MEQVWDMIVLNLLFSLFQRVAQTKAAKERLDDYVHETNKPLARYKDDKDLDAMLKDQDRDDDPMLAYMQKKKATGNKKAGVKG